MPDLTQTISDLLDAAGVPYKLLDHPPAYTAAEAATVRGTAPEIGGKAIVMKVQRVGFAVLALRGCDAVNNRAFRQHLGIQRYRFATREELAHHTGLAPGCVPPLGHPVFSLPLFVDQRLADNPQIAFTCGTHSRSVLMATSDWLTAAKPTQIWDFASAPDP